MKAFGPSALSNSELLDILVDGPEPVGGQLLADSGSLVAIRAMTTAELKRYAGEKAALRVKAALELSSRAACEYEPRLKVPNPEAVAKIMQPHVDGQLQEHLWVLSMGSGKLIDVSLVAKGKVDTTAFNFSDVFRPAVRVGAGELILVHNHPSGSLDPSPEDADVTRKAKEIGEVLGIGVLDHLIMATGGRWLSFKERGLL